MVKEFNFPKKFQPPEKPENSENKEVNPQKEANIIDLNERRKKFIPEDDQENGVNLKPMGPELLRFLQIADKVNRFTRSRRIPDIRKRISFRTNLEIVKEYTDDEIKKWLENPNIDEDLKTKYIFYSALVYEARQRGLYLK